MNAINKLIHAPAYMDMAKWYPGETEGLFQYRPSENVYAAVTPQGRVSIGFFDGKDHTFTRTMKFKDQTQFNKFMDIFMKQVQQFKEKKACAIFVPPGPKIII